MLPACTLSACMVSGCIMSGSLIDGDQRADGVRVGSGAKPQKIRLGGATIDHRRVELGDAGDLYGQTTMFPVWVLAMKARCVW